MDNLLLREVEYQIEETPRGVWRRFLYPDRSLFEEFTSHARLFGMPLVHLTRGIDPTTGKRLTARGVIAIGCKAIGVVAIGQLAVGLIAIGQLAVGVLFGIGQATTGVVAIGQLALAALAGFGQAATGYMVIAQFGLGNYVLAQFGLGEHVWDTLAADPAAEDFFRSLLGT